MQASSAPSALLAPVPAASSSAAGVKYIKDWGRSMHDIDSAVASNMLEEGPRGAAATAAERQHTIDAASR